MSQKFCINCAHYSPPPHGEYSDRMNIDNWREKPMCAITTKTFPTTYDPVSGKELVREYSARMLCEVERDTLGLCGADAKFFSAIGQKVTPK